MLLGVKGLSSPVVWGLTLAKLSPETQRVLRETAAESTGWATAEMNRIEDETTAQFGREGMILTAAALLARSPHPTDAEIDMAMSGSVCRCGTYNRMRRAIHRAAEEERR